MRYLRGVEWCLLAIVLAGCEQRPAENNQPPRTVAQVAPAPKPKPEPEPEPEPEPTSRPAEEEILRRAEHENLIRGVYIDMCLELATERAMGIPSNAAQSLDAVANSTELPWRPSMALVRKIASIPEAERKIRRYIRQQAFANGFGKIIQAINAPVTPQSQSADDGRHAAEWAYLVACRSGGNEKEIMLRTAEAVGNGKFPGGIKGLDAARLLRTIPEFERLFIDAAVNTHGEYIAEKMRQLGASSP